MTTHDKSPKSTRTPRRGALGKGITSLLGDLDDVPAVSTKAGMTPKAAAKVGKAEGQILKLRIIDIEPNPHQPRKIFNDQKLNELSKSIKEDGIIQPVVVTNGDEKGKYTLIAGERRWRASQLAGLDTIPAILKEGASEDLLRLALIENIQRSDLNVVEEAEAYQSLIKDFGLTQEQCAQKVGKERSTVTNTLRILNLPAEVQDDLMESVLTMGHARALLSLEEKRLILQARDQIIKKNLTVRQAEQLCKRMKATGSLGAGGSKSAVSVDPDLEYISETIRNRLRTKVKLTGSAQKGKIEISYFSAADLERIVETLG